MSTSRSSPATAVGARFSFVASESPHPASDIEINSEVAKLNALKNDPTSQASTVGPAPPRGNVGWAQRQLAAPTPYPGGSASEGPSTLA